DHQALNGVSSEPKRIRIRDEVGDDLPLCPRKNGNFIEVILVVDPTVIPRCCLPYAQFFLGHGIDRRNGSVGGIIDQKPNVLSRWRPQSELYGALRKMSTESTIKVKQ